MAMERVNKELLFLAEDVMTWSGKRFKANNRKKLSQAIIN